MHDVWRVASEYPLSPFTIALALWLVAAWCYAKRMRRVATGLAAVGLLGIVIASLPAVAVAVVGLAEQQVPAVPVEATPAAGAILLLGGALAMPHPREPERFQLTRASDRIWHAAALFRAGRAPVVLVAAGPEPGPRARHKAEAHAIAELLAAHGVPRSAIVLETGSRNTRENAANSWPMLERLGVRRVLLVTSPSHMPRALKTFQMVWPAWAPELVPAAPRPSATSGGNGLEMWIPDGSALLDVTKCLKEFAGIAVLGIIGSVTIPF